MIRGFAALHPVKHTRIGAATLASTAVRAESRPLRSTNALLGDHHVVDVEVNGLTGALFCIDGQASGTLE